MPAGELELLRVSRALIVTAAWSRWREESALGAAPYRPFGCFSEHMTQS